MSLIWFKKFDCSRYVVSPEPKLEISERLDVLKRQINTEIQESDKFDRLLQEALHQWQWWVRWQLIVITANSHDSWQSRKLIVITANSHDSWKSWQLTVMTADSYDSWQLWQFTVMTAALTVIRTKCEYSCSTFQISISKRIIQWYIINYKVHVMYFLGIFE